MRHPLNTPFLPIIAAPLREMQNLSPDYWADYRSGSTTHFEALRRYFAAIRASEEEVLAVVRQMDLDPNLRAAVQTLRGAGWDVIVTSAGCEWYIRNLLSIAGVDVTIYANPGRYEPGKGLIVEMPLDSPYFSRSLGVDKTAIVRHHVSDGRKVAFAGDGFPDADPARLVPAQLRFARGDLADVLYREGLEFTPFDTWSHIPPLLLQKS